MQKNDYLLAKFGVDTAENEPLRARLRARLNIGVRRVSAALSAAAGAPSALASSSGVAD